MPDALVPRSRSLDANGLRHHVLEWEGPAERTILLLHGYLDSARTFGPVASRLAARGFRVVAPDLRGHGDTGWAPPGAYYHFPDYLADVVALLPALVGEAGPFALLGHSMGGTVSVLFAGTLPERLGALVLAEGLGAPVMPPEVAPQRLRRWLEGMERSATRARKKMADLEDACARLALTHGGLVPREVLLRVAEQLSTAHPSGEGLAWRFDPLHQTTSPMRFDREAFRAVAAEITAPTLLLDGGEQGLRFGDEAERESWFPRAQKRSLAGAGHMMHWTQPEAFAEAVAGFLEGLPPRR